MSICVLRNTNCACCYKIYKVNPLNFLERCRISPLDRIVKDLEQALIANNTLLCTSHEFSVNRPGGPGLPKSPGGLPTFILTALTLIIPASTRKAKFPVRWVRWQKMTGEQTTEPHLHGMQQEHMADIFLSGGE